MDKKVGRNDPCPCGSGKKYKNCCINQQEEKKKVCTLSGKRKFKAKVIDSNSVALGMFGKMGVPSVAENPDLLAKLRFRMTDHDYRPDSVEVAPSSSSINPIAIQGEPFSPQHQPGDKFKMATDDFRLEEK